MYLFFFILVLGFVFFPSQKPDLILFMAVLCHDSKTARSAPGGTECSLHACSSKEIIFNKTH